MPRWWGVQNENPMQAVCEVKPGSRGLKLLGLGRIPESLRPWTWLPILLAIMGIVRRSPPDRYSFYPVCPIYSYLHFQCPGCGTTRAFAAALHGHILEALRLNPLTTVLVPIAVIHVVTRLMENRRSLEPLHTLQPAPRITYALLGMSVIFTIARNL